MTLPLSPGETPVAPAPFFHDMSGTVRFWVVVNGELMGASISRDTLHYRFRPDAQGEDPLETYRAYLVDIEAAVRRRVAAGSLEPVMIREYDLRPGAV